ncbi:MAG: ATP-binding protein [Bacteroidales bacterium]|nr:ATP-binding protein [Bacteroidales bacterium]
MDGPFVYETFVTGKNFVGRKSEVTALSNMLSAGENVCIYEPPKTGKHSVIQQALFTMRMSHLQFTSCEMSVMGSRTIPEFLIKFASTLLRACASTAYEYGNIVATHLANTHFVFDQQRFSDHGELVSLNWDLDDDDIRSMILLPFKMASQMDQPVIFILDDFQWAQRLDDGDRLLRIMDGVLKETVQAPKPKCSFVMCGSEVNAMNVIFKKTRFFYRTVERLSLNPFDGKEIIDNVVKGFLASGKVAERDQLMAVCNLLKNHFWYINHFASICDYLSKGFISTPVLMDTLAKMISLHEARFKSIMADLTNFQISLLKAIVEGHLRFSATDVINRYGLNSSANVKRLKDALMKKEIIVFDDNDEPQITDPLFEYWVTKYYFGLTPRGEGDLDF